MARRRHVVLRWDRARRAVAAGTLATVAFSLLTPLPSSAATPRQYRDEFTVKDVYTGTDGSDPWNGPWIELGDDMDPASGAFSVTNDGHCPDDICLLIGKDSNPSGSVVRGFDSSGAAVVSLTFDYQRHVHGSGTGEVRLLLSSDGLSWDTIDVFPLNVDDGDPQTATYDISAYTGSAAALRFELISSLDDSHLDIDNVEVVASDSDTPLFDSVIDDRTDAEGDVVSIDAGATDPNGDTLDYSATGLPPGISIDTATGIISGTLAYTAAASSPHAVQVVVTDPAMNSDVENFTWTVTNTNRDPTAADRAASVAEDDPGGVTIDLLDSSYVSDPDLDTLVLVAIDTTALVGGTVTDNGDGTVTYTPSADFDQVDSFDYTVGDGNGGSATSTVTVTVIGAPDDPVLDALPALSIAEETAATFTATAVDVDTGAVLQFSLHDGPDPVPSAASIGLGTGSFSWLTDEYDGPGTYTFTVRATDDTGRFDEATVTIDVAESNNAPILGPVPDQVDAESDTVTLWVPVTDTDIPVGTLTFGATGLPEGLSIDPATGEIAGVVSYDGSDGSPHTITVTVQDSGTPPLADSTAFSWWITDTNRPPVPGAAPAGTTVAEGDAVYVSPTFSDADGDALFFSATGLPPGLAVNPLTGAVSGVIARGASLGSPYTVVVSAKDSQGASAVASFTITVTPPPNPPPTTTTTTVPSTSTTDTPGTSSTTIPPTTTTTTGSPTSTTPPPATTTRTTSPPPPSTTPTTPSSTTTTIQESTQAPPTTHSVPHLDPAVREEVSKAKEDLVIEVGGSSLSQGDDEGGQRSLEPREGLAVSFVSAVETLRSQLLTSLLLGIGVAILLLLGIDEREDTAPA